MTKNETCVLRIYYKHGKKINHNNFWKNIINNSLGHYLMQQAKKCDIEQANLFHAKEGYLNYESIKKNISDIPPLKNTVCLELVDSQEKIETYIEKIETQIHLTTKILINNNTYSLL